MTAGKAKGAALSLWILANGCAPPEPFIGQIHDSEFFTYHQEAQAALCPSLLTRLDEYVRNVLDQIGVGAKTRPPHFRYFKFRDEESFQEKQNVCPAHWGGCAIDEAVYSVQPFHTHELAHLVTLHAWGGQSVRLLNEGEAVALSCDPSETSVSPPAGMTMPPDWRQYLDIYGDDAYGYRLAGTFITHLATRYGWGKVGELHRSVGLDTSAEQLAAHFARVFPLSIDVAWAEATANPRASHCFTDWVCNGGPAIPGTFISADCDGETHQRIETTGYAGVVLAVGASNVSLTECDRSEPSHVLTGGDTFSRPSVTHFTALPPGSYAITHVAAEPPKDLRHIEYLEADFVATGDRMQFSSRILAGQERTEHD
jgi:hypothetical protein